MHTSNRALGVGAARAGAVVAVLLGALSACETQADSNVAPGEGAAVVPGIASFEVLDWAATMATAKVVRAKYGIDWPLAPARTSADGNQIHCTDEPPAIVLQKKMDELVKKYGKEFEQLVVHGPLASPRPAFPGPGNAVVHGRNAILLCDLTMVWSDPAKDFSKPQVVYDAPAGGNRLGVYDPANPDRLT